MFSAQLYRLPESVPRNATTMALRAGQ
jgi:hypothetical protein